jgi:hypothetical protein
MSQGMRTQPWSPSAPVAHPVGLFVFFGEAEPNIAKNAGPKQQEADMGHEQGMSMEVVSSPRALFSIFAPVRFAVVCQSAAEVLLRVRDVLPCYLAISSALGALIPRPRLGLLLAGIKCA